MTEQLLAEHIDRLVAKAPPLTIQQKVKLTALLAPMRPATSTPSRMSSRTDVIERLAEGLVDE